VGKETIIFGVIANSSLVSGILINHYKSYADKTPAIIDNKLKIMVSGLLNTEANFMDVVFTQ
jgi:hypothetical protein